MKSKNHSFWKGTWNFEISDSKGTIIEKWSKQNDLADEGERSLLDVYFRGQNIPSTFYVRLFNDTPVETDTLSDLVGEPSGHGYSPIPLQVNTTDFPTLELDGGDYQVVSKQITFAATGGSIGPVTYAILATTTKLIAYVALSQARTLTNGQTLKITFTIKLQ